VKLQCDARILVAGKKVADDLGEFVRCGELQIIVNRRQNNGLDERVADTSRHYSKSTTIHE
jgi:hypothetical protein